MCGIAVAVNWDDAENAVRRLTGGILHRGDITDPVFSPSPRIAMCTRRLRIVDAALGQQPQASFDGQIVVSFNGEIYNHKILRAELEAMGIVFRTGSDTEVLANALRAWGGKALGRLSGMFGFVALDMRNGEFLAARDPFGVKPLYVLQSGDGFLFCSEIRPLLETAPDGDVMLVPPGHFLTPAGCGRYYASPQPGAAIETSPAIVDGLLDRAVAMRLPDDLPVACLFSGGIDSTLMVHYARRHRADVPAYFGGMDDAPDAIFAAAYAELTGLDLRKVDCQAQANSLDMVRKIVGAVETFEPVVIRPALYAWQVSERIHQDGFRVALSGEGADELFAGYAHLERAYAHGDAAGQGVRQQCLDLMHRANLQRLDRCGMQFEVEVREPFLDRDLADHACRLNGAQLLRAADGRGKEPLRAIYDLYPGELPTMIRDRRKIGFDEGAGLKENGGWRDLFEQAISDAELADGKREFAEYGINGKEDLFCLRALAGAMDIARVPHLKSRLLLLMPQMREAAA